jgi:glutamine amidotransferase
VSAIAVLDYGAGNLTSVLKGLRAADASPIVTADPGTVARADAIVIPGVGHFGATSAIAAEMRGTLLSAVAAGTPILGICLGLQFLFTGSVEAPGVPGLGLLPGECSLLRGAPGVKIPHVGWNSLTIPASSRLLAGIDDGAQVYFTHSYAAPVMDATTATCEHGGTFSAVVERGRVFGVQFHPEKSGETGLRILRAFVQVC